MREFTLEGPEALMAISGYIRDAVAAIAQYQAHPPTVQGKDTFILMCASDLNTAERSILANDVH
ncbi:hypothetical protein [Sabulibacter ruber]|uniref:hypothetical protein n=1 Tax=Sabulibacter ruber TaxID=2811901 RepID=UPI001A970E09|nr:hypothetical protein [Sabulibacter ruber]